MILSLKEAKGFLKEKESFNCSKVSQHFQITRYFCHLIAQVRISYLRGKILHKIFQDTDYSEDKYLHFSEAWSTLYNPGRILLIPGVSYISDQ